MAEEKNLKVIYMNCYTKVTKDNDFNYVRAYEQ